MTSHNSAACLKGSKPLRDSSKESVRQMQARNKTPGRPKKDQSRSNSLTKNWSKKDIQEFKKWQSKSAHRTRSKDRNETSSDTKVESENPSDDENLTSSRVNRVRSGKSHRHHTLREETLDNDDHDIKPVRCRMVTLKILRRNKTNLSSLEDTPRVEMWSYKVKRKATNNRLGTKFRILVLV